MINSLIVNGETITPDGGEYYFDVHVAEGINPYFMIFSRITSNGVAVSTESFGTVLQSQKLIKNGTQYEIPEDSAIRISRAEGVLDDKFATLVKLHKNNSTYRCTIIDDRDEAVDIVLTYTMSKKFFDDPAIVITV